jgi:hydrogenase nickel incorporation protein HypB
LTDLRDGVVVRLDEREQEPMPDHPHAHDHPHPHDHPHRHDHPHETETVTLEARVLAKNDALAVRNRAWLAERGLFAVNLMSSPGSGKTTLLERTVQMLAGATPINVVEGDQETTFDAERIRAAGAPVLQVNTGAGCHLDAAMLASALRTLDPRAGVVLIENVGNLVCPALFDLGEAARVVIMSVTEGADKPLKYPHIFGSATVVLLNKIDLLPYVDFDLQRFEHDVRLVNRNAPIVQVSATRGDGLDEWRAWIVAQSGKA